MVGKSRESVIFAPMKYLLRLAYKGTNYSGWQRQPNVTSVQGVLEDAVKKLVGKKTNVIGCGRTDAGVHARQYFAHIRVDEPLPAKATYKLNNILPNDISIFDIKEADPKFHAQTSAKSRTYEYYVHYQKNAFLSEISSFYFNKDWDIEKVKAATALLLRYDNFRAFCKQPDSHNHTYCNLTRAFVKINQTTGSLHFTFTSNRFLKNMIRILVGNIMAVGHGRLSLEDFEKSLLTGEPLPFWNLAPPEGLFLTGVEY